MRLLANQRVEGGLANIYKSIEDYGDKIMHPSRNKDDLIKPKVVTINTTDPQELLDIQTTSYAFFNSYSCRLMFQAMRIASPPILVEPSEKSLSDDGGYVRGKLTYMVMDDLSLRPNSAVFGIAMLNRLDIKNTVTVKTREVCLGTNEAFKLLKASLYSKTVY
ncbi:hypothetical protein SLEP1_g37551 [Rubroshorea leprosula]|uniref:Uncharacterized protein n=1 Tax=Rubroshorea leprosula TaxID=152421 RepID=A0AAV5KVN1_9ROSI|nr:hypothetical protein SLEP1_g37551 [Rubroshorea leprosula]